VLTLMLGAHAIAPKQARSCCSPTQHRAGVLVAASPGRIFGQLVSGLLVNTKIRGRDQRHIWLRAIALIHPHTRLLLMVIAATAAVAIWLRPGWTHECVPLSMFGTTLALCRAVVAVALVASGASATTLAIAYEVYRGAAEERKDASLCEELLAAAASSAAYEESVEHRLAELRRRGVESANWHVDERLSDATVAVFYNHHEQRVVVAFRGSASLADWSSNLRRIVPGDLENSPSFQRCLATARAVQAKYVLCTNILLTGHSRGGTVADFAGRKLGLPSTTFNPATWGKAFQEQEPARRSVTVRTGDLISSLEALLPGDRTVTTRPAKHRLRNVAVLGAALTCFAIASRDWPLSWLQATARVSFWILIGLYLVWVHTVLNFTPQ